MWPFERAADPEVLRIGRMAAERWARSSTGLTLIASVALPTGRSLKPSDLAPAIAEIYRDNPSGSVSLVLESAWLPVMLVDAGTSVLSTRQIHMLVRHRLGLLYGGSDDPVSGWDVRVEHRAGDRHAVAYGLSARLKDALLATAQSVGIEWRAMTPAFDWGRQQLRPEKPLRQQRGWWVWTEQDRLLVARMASGRVVGLNPGASSVDAEDAVLDHVRTEQVRLGLEPNSDPVLVGHWGPSRAPKRAVDRVVWRGLGASTGSTARTSSTPRAAEAPT